MASTSFTGFYQARESYLRWLDAYLESHPAGEPQAQAAVGEKLDRVWWQWHSKSFKRRSICRAGKVLSPALMVRAYSAWSKLRRSTMAGGVGSLYPSGLGSLFLL